MDVEAFAARVADSIDEQAGKYQNAWGEHKEDRMAMELATVLHIIAAAVRKAAEEG